MTTIKTLLRTWLARIDGATGVEYSLMAAGISLAIALTTFTFGAEIAAFFDTFFDEMPNQ
jgi:Flp pilus assembly pilin Flp